MIDRIFLDVITNIFGVFIIITLYLLTDFSNIDQLSVDGVLLPLEEKNQKEFFYFEIVGNYAVPIGLGGNCNKDLYNIIKLSSDSYMCVLPDNVLEKKRNEFNVHNASSRLIKTIDMFSFDNVYFVLLTRPSGFLVYHEVARKMKNAGFQVGWSPLEEETPLTFGSNGRRIGSQ